MRLLEQHHRCQQTRDHRAVRIALGQNTTDKIQTILGIFNDWWSRGIF